MASEPIYVGAPLGPAVVIDAVFVPDSQYEFANGEWLLEFSNGVTREFRTKAAYFLRSSDFLGKGQYQAEGAVRLADVRHEMDASSPRRQPVQRRCQCETCRRW